MVTQSRMSPLTALVIGIFGLGAVSIGSATAIVLCGLGIADDKVRETLRFAERTIGSTLEGLPELIDSLPDAVEELLNSLEQ